MAFANDQTVTIVGDKTKQIYAIELIVNANALLRFTKNGITKVSHWQHCSELKLLKNVTTTQAVSGANNRSRL